MTAPCPRCGGSGEVDGETAKTPRCDGILMFGVVEPRPGYKFVTRWKPAFEESGPAMMDPSPEMYETFRVVTCPSCLGNVTVSRRELEELRGIARAYELEHSRWRCESCGAMARSLLDLKCGAECATTRARAMKGGG